MSDSNSNTDLRVSNECGFFSIFAETKRGEDWLKDNVPDQARGVVYSDDRRLAWEICQGAMTDGLEVR